MCPTNTKGFRRGEEGGKRTPRGVDDSVFGSHPPPSPYTDGATHVVSVGLLIDKEPGGGGGWTVAP